MAIADDVDQAHAKIVYDGGKAWCSDQRYDAYRRQFDMAIGDREIRTPIQAGWIDDPVRHGLVLMESKRPRPREDFATSVDTPIPDCVALAGGDPQSSQSLRSAAFLRSRLPRGMAALSQPPSVDYG